MTEPGTTSLISTPVETVEDAYVKTYENFKPFEISEEDIFEIATSQGAKDCLIKDDTHEIITKKEDFYRIKTTLEKRIDNLTYSAIEWRAKNYLNLNKEQSEKMIELLNSLEEIDDTQNVFINANLNK